MKDIKETRHRLNWKGMLLLSESLLYADPDTPWILMLPILVFLYLPALFLSYLKLSDAGVELFYWPGFRLNSSWEDIERLGYVTLLGKIPHDALFIKSNPEQMQTVSRQKGIREKRIIPLSDFRGWPEGYLLSELKRYIPELLLRKGNQSKHE
jgi:hypothetical protein